MEGRRIIDLSERTRARHVPAGRALHLVDLENLAGGSQVDPAVLTAAIAAYERAAGFGLADHRVVACGRGLVFAAKTAWPGALVKVARGIDGADRMLLEVADDPGFIAARYAKVVVASGDHIFAGLAKGLRQRGMDVWVVSRPESLSRFLMSAASSVHLLHGISPGVECQPA